MNRDDIIRIARRYGTPVQKQNGEVEYLFNVDTLIALMIAEQDVPEADCGNMEPVAWWNPQYETDSYAFSDEKSDEWRVPLYTHPPRRLTDEVIADLWHRNGTYHHHFARAIERWLKGEE